ncbi:MAG: ABC transporter permease [Candidatus Dormibacteraeota bacterium]|nr:ABC transporter permease [Candidatus Dormibacteraeota bacterium]
MNVTYTARDTMTMIRRDALHAWRNPMLSISGILTPVVFLLLFVGVFGGSMSKALGAGAAALPYIVYLTPGIILMAVGSSVSGTAISVTVDKGEGIIARFRTMAIARTSVLTGAVVGGVLRTMLGILVVLAVAVVLGFRTPAGATQWAEALGLIVLLLLSLTWLAVAFGLFSTSAAGANSLGLIPGFLPLVSSAFTPTSSMPAGVRWFAEHQPYTPIIETLRALLTGTPVGDNGILAVGWCLIIGAAGYLWARRLYNRDPSRQTGPTIAQLMSH